MIFLRGNGIVISKKEIEEADRYITVFMEDFGRISTLVKGIRKRSLLGHMLSSLR